MGRVGEVSTGGGKGIVRGMKQGVLLAGLLWMAVMLASCGQSSQTTPSATDGGREDAASRVATPTKGEATAAKECRELVGAQKWAEALPVCEATAKKYPKNAEVKYLQAYCLQRLNKRLEEAAGLYDQAQALGFDPFWISYNRGLLYMWGLKDAGKGRKDLERALSLDKGGTHQETIKKVLAAPVSAAAPVASGPPPAEVAALKECRDLVNAGKVAQALPVCEAAARKYPKNAEAKYLQAYCLQTTHTRLKEAAQLYDQAQAQGFDPFWISYNRGLLYLWGLKDKKRAQKDLEQALYLDKGGAHKAVIKKVLASAR